MIDHTTYRHRIGRFYAASVWSNQSKHGHVTSNPRISRQSKTSINTLICVFIIISAVEVYLLKDTQIPVQNLYRRDIQNPSLYYPDIQTPSRNHLDVQCFTELIVNLWVNFFGNRQTYLYDDIYCSHWELNSIISCSVTSVKVTAQHTSLGTCSYLLGNVGVHSYNGNPPMFSWFFRRSRRRNSAPVAEERIKKLHHEMVHELSNYLDPTVEREWQQLIGLLKVYFKPVAIRNIKNMSDVCEKLLTKGKIQYGQYDTLRDMFSCIEHQICCNIVDTYSQQIEESQRLGIEPHTVQPHRESHTTQPPREFHTVQPPRESHTLQPPRESHTLQPPGESHTTQPPRESHTMQPPRESHTLQPPGESHTTQPPREFHTMQPPREFHIAQPSRESQKTGMMSSSTDYDMDSLAQHTAGLGTAETVYSRDTAASSHNKMPSVDMEATVKVWEANDKLCYETKGIKDVVQRISCDEHSYICVVGEPGSGKSIAIRHAALYLKDKCGFTVYPVLGPKQFLDYLDPDKRQAFVIDDYLGEYFLDQDKLKVWNNHIEKIKNCLQVHKNTKFLFSLRIQLYSELKSKGNAPMCNDQRHVINFSEKEYKLNRDTMKAMLRHYLQVKHVQNIEGLIGRVRWGKTEQFAGCFPLLCKVFSEDESVRVNPEKYFSDPLPVLQNIFKRIQSENKHQFCGLLLCGITELKDEYFSPLSELKKPKHFNILIKSQKLNPETDLEDIKQALDNLDGVYISHMGNKYTFLHSIFQNIVTFLYDDKYYVFKYATLDFIHERVRLFSKFDTDDDYVKVFYGDDCVKLLVDRMIEELQSDDTDRRRYWKGVRFIVNSHYIDNKELITCLMEKLFDSEHTRITQDKIHELFGNCLEAVCLYTQSHPHTDETSCAQYQLLLSLIARCDCNRQIKRWRLWGYPLHKSVEYGLLHVTKALVEHQADVNVVDRYNYCVLHWALDCTNNVDMTKYLFSLPNLKCLNHRDFRGHTPYWYIVNNKLPPLYFYDDVPHRDELIQLYKHKAAICK